MVEPTIASGPHEDASRNTLFDAVEATSGKAGLRRVLLARRRALSGPERRGQELAIARRLIDLLEVDSTPCIGVFTAIAAEPDLLDAWQRLHAAGVPLALPVVVERDAALIYRAWSPGDALAVDMAGVPAPLPAAPTVEVDVLIVPCVALHPEGWRLGYGGGYFDRTLAGTQRPIRTIGIAFDFQCGRFPTDAHDVRLDEAVTPSGHLRFG